MFLDLNLLSYIVSQSFNMLSQYICSLYVPLSQSFNMLSLYVCSLFVHLSQSFNVYSISIFKNIFTKYIYMFLICSFISIF